MIISDKFQFVFVHIPKCAGTTVRNALAPFDEAAERYFDKAVSEHPVLGPLDYPHIPLAVLADYFPEDLARLDGCGSFAFITRLQRECVCVIHKVKRLADVFG